MKTWSTEEVPNTLGSPVSTFYLLSLLCTLTNEMTFQYTIENKLFDKIVQYIYIMQYLNTKIQGFMGLPNTTVDPAVRRPQLS